MYPRPALNSCFLCLAPPKFWDYFYKPLHSAYSQSLISTSVKTVDSDRLAESRFFKAHVCLCGFVHVNMSAHGARREAGVAGSRELPDMDAGS